MSQLALTVEFDTNGEVLTVYGPDKGPLPRGDLNAPHLQGVKFVSLGSYEIFVVEKDGRLYACKHRRPCDTWCADITDVV